MRLKTLTLVLASFVAFTFVGCEHVSSVLYDKQIVDTGQVTAVDSVNTGDGYLVPVSEYTGNLEEADIVPAGSPIHQEVYTPKPWVKIAAEGAKSLPIPFADVGGYLLAGALGIGSVWLNRRKRTADKINESLVKGVDVIRDSLLMTEEGRKIDERVKTILREHQDALGVADAVNKLLQRYATPKKEPFAS